MLEDGALGRTGRRRPRPGLSAATPSTRADAAAAATIRAWPRAPFEAIAAELGEASVSKWEGIVINDRFVRTRPNRRAARPIEAAGGAVGSAAGRGDRTTHLEERDGPEGAARADQRGTHRRFCMLFIIQFCIATVRDQLNPQIGGACRWRRAPDAQLGMAVVGGSRRHASLHLGRPTRRFALFGPRPLSETFGAERPRLSLDDDPHAD